MGTRTSAWAACKNFNPDYNTFKSVFVFDADIANDSIFFVVYTHGCQANKGGLGT